MAGGDELEIRRALPGEARVFGRWARAEGWNPGDGDCDCYFAAAPDGFYVALAADDREEPEDDAYATGDVDAARGDGRRLVGALSLARHTPRYAFFGYFIVRPSWRGRGVGRRLFDAALGPAAAAADGGTTIGLDGVPAQTGRYARWLGFREAFGVVRYGGSLQPPAAAAAEAAAGDVEVVPAAAVPLAALLAYERPFLGPDAGEPPEARAAFLRLWTAPGRPAACALAPGGALAGFGAARRAASGGLRVGPLYARDPAAAEALLRALAPPGAALQLDVPDCSPPAVALAERLGLRPAFRCVRMYAGGERGGAPGMAGVYGTFSLEIGP